ncbi:MAG: hypothetical protein Q9M31_04990 [Mariprofundus sp.]|nr:hypothetical protein [Mariprofundus sp.]
MIFRHPVGLFPAAARWYLAAIAMLSLISVGIHLVVQEHAQQQAEILIKQWGVQSGVEISNVRYHLLRNGLVLQNIHIQRQRDSLDIQHMLIQANPRLLISEHPRLGKVSMSGVTATLHMQGDRSSWLNAPRLKQLWLATSHLSLQHGRLQLYVAAGKAQPLAINKLAFDLSTQGKNRFLRGSGHLQQGTLQWQWSQTETARQGYIHWQQLDAQQLCRALHLQALKGDLSGELQWHETVASKHATISGQTTLLTRAERVRMHRLAWDGSKQDDQWQINMKANAWPLLPWSNFLPTIADRKLTAGQVEGTFHWLHKDKHWLLSSEQGKLYDITYAAAGLPTWYWSRIHYQQLQLDPIQQRLSVAKAELNDSRLILSTTPTQPTNTKVTSAWQLSAENIRFYNMMLAVSLPRGQITLTNIEGRANWPAGKPLAFDLKTTDAAADAETAVAAWFLQGQLARDPLTGAAFKVIGQNINLPSLRALLPFQDEGAGNTSLHGKSSLDISVNIQQGIWQMQGEAAARNLSLNHAGNKWSAKQFSTTFGPVGIGLQQQHIHAIEAKDWQYTAVMHPMQTTMQEKPNTTNSLTPSWWITALKNNHYQIDTLHWQQGTLSVGEPDAHWGENIELNMKQIEENHWAKTSIHGLAGGGYFSLNGELKLLAEQPRMRGTAQLNNALPFFLNNWLTASGMPRLLRGRLSAQITMGELEAEHKRWQSHVEIALKRGLFEQGESPSDPMLARTGFKAVELLAELQNSQGQINARYDMQGDWNSLSEDNFGTGLQQWLSSSIKQKRALKKTTNSTPLLHFETRIRLREGKRLTLNERTRLHSVAVKLYHNPDAMVQLRPEWIGSSLTAEKIDRIQQTQQAIQNYLIYRHVNVGRIFPIWPSAANHTDETGSIWIETAH